MSVNPDAMDSIDYSDFEYQSAKINVVAGESDDSTGGGNINVKAVSDFDVLGGIGGLDNNEVAELVYLETNAKLNFQDSEADQDVASTGSLEGVVGANLPPSTDAFPSGRSLSSNNDVVSTSQIDEANVDVFTVGDSEDRWFQIFDSAASVPFDDQTNGPGGAGSVEAFYAEKHFRNTVGRGPVLDSSDTMSAAIDLEVDDTIIDATANLNLHMVWDVAETSDAGRAFSVPN